MSEKRTYDHIFPLLHPEQKKSHPILLRSMECNGPIEDSSLHDKQLELENVQRVIQVTKENIDTLNERFARFNPSPQIYLNEYQELTSKLHGFKMLEQNLVERIQSIQKRNEVRVILRFTGFTASYLAIFFRWTREHTQHQSCRSRRSFVRICRTSNEHRCRW